MPNGPLTLLDLAARSGDNVAAVIEDVTTLAPEFATVPAITRSGTSYDVLRRIALPNGSFRKVGNGVNVTKSEWDRETKPMYVFEALMQIGEDIVKAQTAQSRATVGDILADEAMANVRGSTINFGLQMYYGQNASANGFTGLATQVFNDLDNQGAASNAGSINTSVYLCWMDSSPVNPQGIHFAVGEDGAFNFGDWFRQQVVSLDNKKTIAWVNNFMFFAGFAIGSTKAVSRVKNCTTLKPFTDSVGAQLISQIPVARRKDLRWFMNRDAAYQLQQSRQTTIAIGTGTNKGVTGAGVFPEMPTECQGYPITLTDSLLSTESGGNLQAALGL